MAERTLEQLFQEFRDFIVARKFVADEDVNDLNALFIKMVTMKGDINVQLATWTELYTRISWIQLKYSRQLAVLNREASRKFDEIYAIYRTCGIDPSTGTKVDEQPDGVAKAIARTHPHYVQIENKRDLMQEVIDFIDRLTQVVFERKSLMEQISNNLRKELTSDQATIPQ